MAATLPVLSYATGAGWSTLGFAASIEGAKAIARRHLSDASLSLIKNFGFELSVHRRSPLAIELNGGPEGYVFGVGKAVKTRS